MARAKDKTESARKLGVETARSGMVYLLGEAVSSIVSLAVLIFLARTLKPAEFGVFAIVIAFNTLLGVGGNFGVGTAFRKHLPQLKRKSVQSGKLLGSGYVVALVAGLIISLVGILFSGQIASFVYHLPSLTLALRIASATVFFTVLFNLTMAALVGLDKVKESATANIIYAASQFVAVSLLVLAGYGVEGAIIGVAISFIIAASYGLLMLLTSGIRMRRPERTAIKKVLSFSAPVVVSHIAAIGAENFAILLLGIFATASMVGNYNAAFKIGRFVQIVLVSNTFILLPAFSKAFSKKNLSGSIGKIYNNSLFYTLLFLLPVVAFLVAVSTPLMHLLFSSEYSQAPLYFAFVAIGTSIGIIGSYAGTLIISYGNTRKFMKYQMTAVIVEVGLLLLLTPSFKAMGVLLALFVIAPIVLDFIYVRALYTQFKFKHTIGRLLLVIVPSLLLFAACAFMSIFVMNGSIIAIPVDLVIALLLYPALLGLLGVLTRSDTSFIRSVSESYRLRSVADYALRYVELFMR